MDLYGIFNRMSWMTAKDLRFWFVGRAEAVHYDSPKIVEAIVRLRLLGNGVPVFRLDWDVLFRDDNCDTAQLGLFQAVATCLKAYQLRLADPRIATFLFSASYDTDAVFDPDRAHDFDPWIGAFATRVFPALLVLPDLMKDACDGKLNWHDYAKTAFNEDLALRFYGISRPSGERGLVSNGVAGIAELGAHPLVSVVSGAMLCLSEGAILDLPPFSNFLMNVSWIDDHLKYSLHRELRHLISVDWDVDPDLSSAKIDAVLLPKRRAMQFDNRRGGLPGYVLGTYLPTLLWGAIMDAWITPDALLKFRGRALRDTSAKEPGSLYECWRGLPRTGQSNGVLPMALQSALRKGSFITSDRMDLKKNMTAAALKRMTVVRSQWAKLCQGETHTFASLWATGCARRIISSPEKGFGMVEEDVAPNQPIERPEQISRYLRDDFDNLIVDAMEYVEWTLNWPKIVQVVRSIEQGQVETDISWSWRGRDPR